jgi:hypothetical protein
LRYPEFRAALSGRAEVHFSAAALMPAAGEHCQVEIH